MGVQNKDERSQEKITTFADIMKEYSCTTFCQKNIHICNGNDNDPYLPITLLKVTSFCTTYYFTSLITNFKNKLQTFAKRSTNSSNFSGVSD